ncbi:MAG: FMN-binding negative transcriptional regulator [Alsobacter sp.]
MYEPPAFREPDDARQHALIRAFPLGLLVTGGAEGPVANPIPFLLDVEPATGRTMLRGHLARANAQWKDCVGGVRALVVFQGPEHYVRPGWYETKRETGKVVPTWNYAMVQASGVATAIEDPAWLHRQVRALTGLMEGERPQPWAVDDAPADFVAAQVKGIVGIEVAVDRLAGKWKASQNRNEADRAGVVAGLAGETAPFARAMAALVAGRDAG